MATDFDPDTSPELDVRVPPQLGGIVKWGLVVLGLILLFVFLSFLRSVYTDWLWFGNLGYRGVFAKILTTRVVLFFSAAAIFGALLSASVYVADRVSRGPETVALPQDALELLRRLVFWGTIAVIVLVSAIFGAVAAGKWELFLKILNSVPFGITDPVYDKDLSFYVFTLPLWSFIQGWLLGAAIVILLATLGRHFMNLSLRGQRFALTPGLSIHVSVIAAVLMFIIGFGHWLDRWELLLSGQGAVFGAAYTDIHARKPALMVLTIIAGGSGVLMLVNAYLGQIRLLVGAGVLWIVMAVILGAAWPGLMQRFSVTPNEFVKEAPYIERNMEFTRRGFALGDDRVEEVFFPVEATLTADVVVANAQTINNIRLWDHGPLSSVYRQIQLIRTYYDFMDADVDRYIVDGEYRQVLLAAREVAPEKLEPESQTWINEKLIYTHGFGLAMSPVTEFTPEGRPEFFARGIPAGGIIPIQSSEPGREPETVITNPRIYYGENTVQHTIVNTNTDELDYQTAEGELFRTKYTGVGGVQLSSLLRRIAFAWQLTDLNVLISGEITGESRIQYRREIQERVRSVAPFLLLDEDPYMVAADGRLVWMQDAYTYTDSYPYSDPSDGDINYVRNSVKVTIDAFDGTVKLYIADPTDPMVRTYEKIFPGLFLPLEEMPATLLAHIRYPLDLFSLQVEKYAKYHMRDPQNLYNNEDLWEIPNEKFGQSDVLQPIEPYYVIMRLPGEEREEFVLLLPYTPNQRKNIVGWLAARSDGENYGKLVAFSFPKDRQVDGPEQIEARIDNDPEISAWFTLRCQEGSFCIRGNLLVIPVGESLLFVEPVYIQAEGVEFPELKRVILATGERVVMAGSLSEALTLLVGDTGSRVAVPVDREEVEPGEQAPPGIGIAAEVDRLSEALGGLKGNITEIEEALERLTELLGQSSTGE